MAGARGAAGRRLGFIGAGAMAEALARGFSQAGVCSAVAACDPSEERRRVFEGHGFSACASAAEVAEASDVVFVAVKPGVVRAVLQDNAAALKGKLVVSIAAGVPLKDLEAFAAVPGGDGPRVVRVMPNTPCLVGASAAAMSLGKNALETDGEVVRELMAAVGTITLVEEKLLGAVTGLSGSGPAYIFILIEALADGGVRAGLPRHVAMELATQTVMGSAKMVQETGMHPAQLKDQVASPGGTTIAGIHALEQAGFRSALMNAVTGAAERASKL